MRRSGLRGIATTSGGLRQSQMDRGLARSGRSQTQRGQRALGSDAARRHVAEDLAVTADKDDTVSGGVSFVPFQFLVGDRNSRPFRDDTLAVGDDGYVFVTAHLEAVGFKGIGFAATRHVRVVRLHQLLKPFTQVGGLIAPLSVVACQRRQRYQHEEDDNSEHAAYHHWVAMPGPVTLSYRSHGRA